METGAAGAQAKRGANRTRLIVNMRLGGGAPDGQDLEAGAGFGAARGHGQLKGA